MACAEVRIMASTRTTAPRNVFSERAQLSIEYLTFIVTAFLILIVATVLIGHRIADASKEKELAALQDMAEALKQEFYFASQAGDGYRRTVELPETLGGINYTVNTTAVQFTLLSDHYDIGVVVPETIGALHKGDNLLINQGGQLCIDSCAGG